MKKRTLPQISRTQILLGEVYPQLVKLRDSEEHGPHGKFDLVYKGFHIQWVGELPEDLIKKNNDTVQWENPSRYNDGVEAGGGTL